MMLQLTGGIEGLTTHCTCKVSLVMLLHLMCVGEDLITHRAGKVHLAMLL